MARAKKTGKKLKSVKLGKRDAQLQRNINETMKKIQQINEISRQKMRRALLIAILGNVAIVLIFVGLVFLIKARFLA